ncbi:host cell factor 1-like [Schistocerca serialis cubense]|uniref:host cell factor 1-like n=1 Tax=Schistocerca serialis cubense TaxID=2023355 RepID=UPI00214E08E5|nr:host cell factor 1-like [Schistocerca serialis cubense]
MAALDLKWQRVQNTSGPKPRPRHGHRAVAIQDMMVVFGGGNEGIVDELNVFNMSTNTWFAPATKGRIPPGCAAYGIAVYGTAILIFGGMVECGKYSDDLYELDVSKWEWRRLRPRPPISGKSPCPRLGHSFTLVDNDVYLFGGLANVGHDSKNNIPLYLNDLYALDLQTKMTAWNIPETRGCRPSPRESHTAVAYENKFTGSSRIIIYGGMNGRRLGDLWFLDCETFSWLKPVLRGVPPQPRSLHTAAVVGERMFIFGGWVPVSTNDGKAETPETEWKCSNSLVSLNLEKLTWEEHAVDESSGSTPRARAGHCTVGVHTRMYVWSGRDGYRRAWNNQICFNDMWYIDVSPPLQPHKVQLAKAQTDELELCWTSVPAADGYRIQLHRYEMPSAVNTTVNPPAPATPPPQPVSSQESSTGSVYDVKVSSPDLLPLEDNTCKLQPMTSTSPLNSRPVSPLLDSFVSENNDFRQQAVQCPPETLTPVMSFVGMPSSTTAPTPMPSVFTGSHVKEDIASVSVLSSKPSLLSVLSGAKLPPHSQNFPDLIPESSLGSNTVTSFSSLKVTAPQTPLTVGEKIVPSVSVSLPTTCPVNSPRNSVFSVSGLATHCTTPHRQHNLSGIMSPTTLLKNNSFPQSKPVVMQKPVHTSNSPLVTFVKTSQGVTVGVPRSSIVQTKPEISQLSTVQSTRQRQISSGGVKIFKTHQKPGLDIKEDWNLMLKQSQNPYRKQTVHVMKPTVPAIEGTTAKFSSNGGHYPFTASPTLCPTQNVLPSQVLHSSNSALTSNIFQQAVSKPSSVKIIVVSSATTSGGIVGKPITIMIPGGSVTPKTVHVGANPITHAGVRADVSQYLATSLPSSLQFPAGTPHIAVTPNEKQQRVQCTAATVAPRTVSSFSNCGPLLTPKSDNMSTRFSTAYDEHCHRMCNNGISRIAKMYLGRRSTCHILKNSSTTYKLSIAPFDIT